MGMWMRQLPDLSAAERTNEQTNLIRYEIIRFKCLGADTKGIKNRNGGKKEQKWRKKNKISFYLYEWSIKIILIEFR